jgi:hypothetical protein
VVGAAGPSSAGPFDLLEQDVLHLELDECPEHYEAHQTKEEVMNNSQRAERVQPLFESYWELDRDERESTLIDLVADLGHLADTFDVDYDRVLERAHEHLAAER